jgi:hypothetical protein
MSSAWDDPLFDPNDDLCLVEEELGYLNLHLVDPSETDDDVVDPFRSLDDDDPDDLDP